MLFVCGWEKSDFVGKEGRRIRIGRMCSENVVCLLDWLLM